MNAISAKTKRRRGLSSLEMVLALPILLLLMALMINFGTVAAWKVRALSIARTAVWSTRWPRNGGSDPRPDYWPAQAGMGVAAIDNVPQLDDPRVNLPVARGPLPFGTVVNSNLLDPTRGFREGRADLTRAFPLVARMGSYSLTGRTQLLDDLWQYERMGLGNNVTRRIPVIYSLAKAPPQLVTDYIQAYMAIITAPFRANLAPLDRDDEFIRYGAMFRWGGAPDFHPRLQGFCTLDQEVADRQVENLIDRIQGKTGTGPNGQVIHLVPSVAETMAHAFIGLYQRVIQELQQAATPDQAQIAQLQKKIDTLNQFLSSL